MMLVAAQSMLPVAMFGLGPTELIIIAVIVVLLFGARRIPELGKSVGEGVRNLKKGLRAAEEEEEAEERKAKAITAQEVEDVSVIESADAPKRKKTTES